MDGESEFLDIFPKDQESPAYGKVFVTLFEEPNCQGKWITFPGAGGYFTHFVLNHYEWDERAHSMEIRWQGSIPPTFVTGQITELATVAPTATPVRAPAAPTVTRAPEASDLEIGFDRPGSDYHNFELSGGPEVCQRACIEDSNCQAFTWVPAGVQGSQARCWLKDTVPAAVASPSFVSGVKTPRPSDPLPPDTSLVNLEGMWNSSLGSVYEIRQNGNQFAWSVEASQEKGSGNYQGTVIFATWSGSAGNGSAQGTITQVDAAGNALRIEWDNGVIFFR